MSTWRKRFSRKSQRLSANDEILLNNTVKYRKKLQTAITQINRTKKSSQHYYESPDSEIHVARLVNDIGQLSDCKSLQQISGLIDSLAMRHQLSSRIFNEYAMNSLQQSLQKLNEHISTDVDKTKSILDEAVTNHCSDHTKKQLFSKVKDEWSTHQKLATKELKQGLNSYCDIGLYHLKIQMAILEKLQSFVDQLPDNDNDDGDPNNELPNFHANSIQTRRDIDTMLRIMLDTAPNNSSALPANKRPKFLNDQLTLSNSLYSQEITEAAASSNFPSVGQRNPPIVLQYPSIPPSTTQTYASPNPTPLTPRNNNNSRDDDNDDQLPSYTDLFVVPSSCKEQRRRRI